MAYYVNNDENAKEQFISDTEITALCEGLISYSAFLRIDKKHEKLKAVQHLLEIFKPTALPKT